MIFAALLFFRFLKHKKSSDFWLAVLLIVLCLSLVTPFIGFANVYDLNQWLTYFPFAIAYSYGVFINEFRIAAVKEKLNNGDAENSNLLGIAFDCEFNSKATFNRAFKKFTGIAPKEFYQDVKINT